MDVLLFLPTHNFPLYQNLGVDANDNDNDYVWNLHDAHEFKDDKFGFYKGWKVLDFCHWSGI